MAALQQYQNRPLYTARELTDRSKDFRTVIIQVLRKDDIKTGRNGKKYQAYILTDMEGTIIGAVSFEPNLNKFNRLLKPYQRYYLSNAWVKPAHPEFQPSDYAHGWTLTNQTHVEHIDDEVPYSIPCTFNFVKFADLPKWIDHTEPLALRCLIVHALPNVETYDDSRKQKYVVIDEDGIAMLLSARPELVDNSYSQLSLKLPQPSMFVFINAKVSTRHGLSLATPNGTSAFYDPPLPGQSSLMQWYQKNTQLVATLLKEETYTNTDILMPFPKPDEIMPIVEALTALDEIRVAWVAGNIYLMPAQEKFWYHACPSCYKKMNQNITWQTTCNYCRARGIAIPRCRVEFFLNDSTETMSITYFGEEAEQLIGHTAIELQATPEKHTAIEKELELALYKKPVTCFVKCYDRTFQGGNVRTHTVIKMYSQAKPAVDASETSAPLLLQSASIEEKKATNDKASKEFFSPTTKMVLEEITTQTSTCGSSSAVPISAKRSLFQATTPTASSETQALLTTQAYASKKTAEHPENQPRLVSEITQTSNKPDGQKTTATTALESPVKKTKNKEKEC